jgi:hypothetical protein
MAERKDDISQDQPFLSRWSERKQRAELDAEGNRPDANSERVEGADAGTVDEEQAANQAAAEAIDIDSLDEDSDYSPFFKDGVPPALKSAALQRLWRSSPVFANIDGLNDYDEDFTIPKTPMGAIKTAWKFGRGFITDDDADKGEIIPEPEMAEAPEIAAGPEAGQSGEDNEETVAEAVISHPDPADDHDSESDPAPDPQSEDATGEKPDPHPAPCVGLRNRLDMAAFSDRDDD